MRLRQVTDLSWGEVAAAQYDVCLAAAGYESRGRRLVEELGTVNAEVKIAFGFTELRDNPERSKNDSAFREKGFESVLGSTNKDEFIFPIMRTMWEKKRANTFRMLVDYSAMSRLWYSAILNWILWLDGPSRVLIDFAYSVAETPQGDQEFVIDEILAIPGFEGRWRTRGEDTAVFGLGLQSNAALCVLDRLEADKVYALVSSGSLEGGYGEEFRRTNKSLLEDPKMMGVIEVPLNSVEQSFIGIAELIAPQAALGNVTIVPMGPKPQVLAALLAGIRIREASVLRVSYLRRKTEHRRAIGTIACCRVEFEQLTDGEAAGSSKAADAANQEARNGFVAEHRGLFP